MSREWGDHAHVKFQLRKYTGAITVYTDHMVPPLKEIPPFGHIHMRIHMVYTYTYTYTYTQVPPLKEIPPFELMSEDQADYEVSMCGLEEGLMYIGLQGESGCATYEIGLTVYNDADVVNGTFAPCEEMGNEGKTGVVYQTLALNAFERGSCDAYSWKDFEFTISAKQEIEKDNLIFQVELLDRDQPNNDAISIHLFDEFIPFNRHTEEVARVPTNGLWTISLSSLDVTGGTYYLSVQCGPLSQRFRTMVVEVQGALKSVSDEVDGEVCPEEWVYHYVNVSREGTSVRRRRRRQLGMSRDAKMGLADREELRRRYLAEGRSLSPSLAGENLMIKVKKFVGSLFFMATEGLNAPRQLLPPYRVMKEEDGTDSVAFCNLQPLDDLGWNLYWLAIVGGDECAVYEVTLMQLPADDLRCANGEKGVPTVPIYCLATPQPS